MQVTVRKNSNMNKPISQIQSQKPKYVTLNNQPTKTNMPMTRILRVGENARPLSKAPKLPPNARERREAKRECRKKILERKRNADDSIISLYLPWAGHLINPWNIKSVEIHSVFIFLLEADRARSTTSAVVARPVLARTTHTSLACIPGAVVVWA